MSLLTTLDNAWGTIGPRMQEGGRLFAAHTGMANALITFSGTSALEAALRALCAGDPDAEVIVAAYGDPRTASVAVAVGAKVVFADVDRETGVLSPACAAAAMTSHTRAVIAETAKLAPYAALGTEKLVAWLPCGPVAPVSGECAAAVYDLGCTSPVNIGAGALAANDPDLFSRMFAYHNCGRPFGERETLSFGCAIIGGDLRVAEFPCALLPDALAHPGSGKPAASVRRLLHRMPVFGALPDDRFPAAVFVNTRSIA